MTLPTFADYDDVSVDLYMCCKSGTLVRNTTASLAHFIMVAYVIGQTNIFLPCDFYLLPFFFFFPRLISAAADWMSTILPHMVWP